jgi:hypothetical protein
MNGFAASFSRQTDAPLSFCFIEGVSAAESAGLEAESPTDVGLPRRLESFHAGTMSHKL